MPVTNWVNFYHNLVRALGKSLTCPQRRPDTGLGLATFRRFLGQRGFPDISIGKESACNAGDPGLIPGLGRSAGKGIGYPFQYSWASLVAQLVKNLPAM